MDICLTDMYMIAFFVWSKVSWELFVVDDVSEADKAREGADDRGEAGWGAFGGCW